MASELKHTVAPSGGDFTSLDAAIDHLVASHANFVTADVYGLVEISGDWSGGADTTAVTVNGLTLDATRYLKTYTDAANRAELASWDANKHRISVSNGTGLYLRDDYIQCDGLQIESYDCATPLYALLIDGLTAINNHIQLSNLRLRVDANSGVTCYILTTNDNDLNLVAWNIIMSARADNQGTIDGFYPAGIASGDLYNCLAYGLRRGFRDPLGSTVSVYDSVSFNNTDDFYGTFAVIDYCASDDNDGTNNVAESGGGAAWPSDFIDAANGDFRLLSGSALKDAASAAGSGLFSTDMDGNIRSDWDVGPSEYVTSGYSLSCDGGSYALTGSDVSPLRAAKVDAAGGSYALTGVDAGTYFGRKVSAEAGAYALTGADAALLRAAKIDADAGAYTLTGQDAALLRAARIAAEAGAYILTGQDVTLVYVPGAGAYILSCDGATYAVTGMSADVLKASRLAAEPGAYALTGMDAATLLGRLIDAGAGAYAVTGGDAALLRAAKLAAESGSYAVTGQAATLRAAAAVLSAWFEALRPSERIITLPESQRIVSVQPSERIVLVRRS